MSRISNADRTHLRNTRVYSPDESERRWVGEPPVVIANVGNFWGEVELETVSDCSHASDVEGTSRARWSTSRRPELGRSVVITFSNSSGDIVTPVVVLNKPFSSSTTPLLAVLLVAAMVESR